MRVLAGSQDAGSTVAMGQAIADGVVGAQLQVLDAAHLSVLEQPEAFLAVVQELLQSLP